MFDMADSDFYFRFIVLIKGFVKIFDNVFKVYWF